ncbi:hypothetical protein HDU92_008267 [Lobulomyces angularis]|nr:hypothetical protein HDU92_008267 [Lobulomyces angularis]
MQPTLSLFFVLLTNFLSIHVSKIAATIQNHRENVKILGTSPEQIDIAENRYKFSRLVDKIGVDQPLWKELTSFEEAKAFCEKVSFPVLVRPSYIKNLNSSMAFKPFSEETTRKYHELFSKAFVGCGNTSFRLDNPNFQKSQKLLASGKPITLLNRKSIVSIVSKIYRPVVDAIGRREKDNSNIGDILPQFIIVFRQIDLVDEPFTVCVTYKK